MTAAYHAVLDNGVAHIVTAHYYTDTQLVLNLYLSVTH
jgi:hypothetical protein